MGKPRSGVWRVGAGSEQQSLIRFSLLRWRAPFEQHFTVKSRKKWNPRSFLEEQ